MSTMTLEQVRDGLHRLSRGRMDYVELRAMADAIDAHLAAREAVVRERKFTTMTARDRFQLFHDMLAEHLLTSDAGTFDIPRHHVEMMRDGFAEALSAQEAASPDVDDIGVVDMPAEPVEQPRGEPVAYQARIPTGQWRECSFDEYEHIAHNRPGDARKLYTTQPKPEQAVGDGVIGYVHPALLGGNALAKEVSPMRLSDAQVPVYITPRPAVSTPVEVTDAMVDAALKTWYLVLTKDKRADMRKAIEAALDAHPHTGYSAVPDGWVASFKAAVQAIEEDEQPITSACSFLLIDQCVTRNAKSVRLEFEDVYGSDGESFGNWTVVVERTAAPEVP